jgi:hypothetical protein
MEISRSAWVISRENDRGRQKRLFRSGYPRAFSPAALFVALSGDDDRIHLLFGDNLQ